MVVFHFYGFFIGLGIVAGLLVIEKVKEKFPDTRYPIPVNCLLFWLVIFGLVGARLYHVIDYWWYYSENLIEIFYLWQGGLGIYGAIAGGLVGLWVFAIIDCYKNTTRKNFRKLFNCSIVKLLNFADLAAFGLPIAQAIGRLGNYFNQELYGLPTNLPWGIYIRLENRLSGYQNFDRFHPLFAYEAVWNLMIFISLIIVINVIKKPKPGTFLFIYLSLYGFGRFWLEYLRINPWEIGGINTAQGISLGLVMIGLIGLIRRKNTLGKLG